MYISHSRLILSNLARKKIFWSKVLCYFLVLTNLLVFPSSCRCDGNSNFGVQIFLNKKNSTFSFRHSSNSLMMLTFPIAMFLFPFPLIVEISLLFHHHMQLANQVLLYIGPVSLLLSHTKLHIPFQLETLASLRPHILFHSAT